MVLFCFSDIYSLPLTRSCYTTPEDTIDLSIIEQFIYIEDMNRKDIYSLNAGIGSYTSIGADFSLIHTEFFEAGETVPGDILLNLWHFIGEYSDGSVKSGLSIVMRIPTGPDAYSDEKYRNLSFGNSELKITPVLSLNLSEKEIMILNMSYTFRAGGGADVYSGIKNNLIDGETDNLENDYASISAGVISSRLLPWTFFSELYYSSGFKDRDADINIEGDGIKPLLLSAGVKYFISESFFIQASDIMDLLQNEGYIKNTVEISLNIFF